MTERIIVSGFGGQGVLAIGQVIAQLNMLKGKNVTWVPSYGPEMRGGTANCSVVVSGEAIGNPLITKNADIVFALNNPSCDKFLPLVKSGGTLIINIPLVNVGIARNDINIVAINAIEIAASLGNPRVQNMAMLGGYLKLHGEFTDEDIKQALIDKFGEKYRTLIPLNLEAVNKGKG